MHELLTLLAISLTLLGCGIYAVDRHVMGIQRDRRAAAARRAVDRACALPSGWTLEEYARDGIKSLHVMLAQARRAER